MAEVPFASPFSRRTNRMEKCLFLKTELELPDTLLEDVSKLIPALVSHQISSFNIYLYCTSFFCFLQMNVFREVVSAQTWNESLSAAQRQELMVSFYIYIYFNNY